MAPQWTSYRCLKRLRKPRGRKRQDTSRSGIPLVDQLGELGKLIGSNNKIAQRTELIIFIRPQIIRDGVDAMRVAEEMRTKLRGRLGTSDPRFTKQ